MTRGLLDTTVFIAKETERPLDVAALPDEVAVSIVTIGELRAGVLATHDPDVRARRLDTLTEALRVEPLPIDDGVAAAWARLRIALRDAGLRMSVNDSWIAATALAHEITLVTQDDDFPAVAGLVVTKV